MFASTFSPVTDNSIYSLLLCVNYNLKDLLNERLSSFILVYFILCFLLGSLIEYEEL